jgi:hypothetical protein
MEVEDWFKGVEKKLVIAPPPSHKPCTSSLVRQQIDGRHTITPMQMLTPSHGMSSRLVSVTTMPRGTMKLKKKEFTDLKQGSMTVNEYLNSFIQLSRYTTEDINTNKKKHDMSLDGLNDDIQFQLLQTESADFHHMVDKAIVIENKLKEMEKDSKRKMPFHGQSSRSNVRPHFSQPN